MPESFLEGCWQLVLGGAGGAVVYLIASRLDPRFRDSWFLAILESAPSIIEHLTTLVSVSQRWDDMPRKMRRAAARKEELDHEN